MRSNIASSVGFTIWVVHGSSKKKCTNEAKARGSKEHSTAVHKPGEAGGIS